MAIGKASLKNYFICGCLGFLVLITAVLGLWEKAELGFYDAWFNLRGKEDPGKDIVIIAMDEKSIEKLGPLPWSRRVHARLLEQLRQAGVVGFDLLFDTPTVPENDTAFAEAIKKHGRVVLASMFSFEQNEKGEWLQQLKTPLPQLAAGMAGVGFINMPADKGNIVRRVTVVDTNTFERPYPSFSLAAALTAAGLNPGDLVFQNRIISSGKLNVPLNEANQALIDFWGPGRTFRTYSYIDVLEGRIAPEAFQNKIALVGIATPTERHDIYENPFTKGNLILAGALPSPGVEIHASAIKTYLTGRYFHRASWPVNLGLLILVWAATVFIARRSSPWAGLFFALLLALALVALAYFLWLKIHYWLNIAAPLVMVTVTYVGATVENIVRTELERRRTKALFGRYVSAPVVEELLRHPEKIELGGIKQEITILFSDIRGFTAFSEGKPPEEVLARLNEYFTAMTEIVFRHGGTLDKYQGDGLMAIFGAPVFYPDHARRAVAAAVDMLGRLEELNRHWEEKGEVTLGIGVG
ncbi:MAG: adenylate/guanylate cyclase domain-containing protein, partial [Bacillota bacterium]